MSSYTYETILKKAKECKSNVEKNYELGINEEWGYYFAQSILNPKKTIKRLKFSKAPKPSGSKISRQISEAGYKKLAKDLINFVESKGRMRNYLDYKNKRIRTRLYVYMFAKILVYYDEHNKMPLEVNVNYKAFYKPTESSNKVYNLFVKTFGKISCIDDALEKIAGKGYGHYNDDQKSNEETIKAIQSGTHEDDPNCTDATQMMKNVGDGTGKYKKIDCIHVHCSGGDGHVFLKFTNKDGSVFYRDPAAVLSSGDIHKIWCRDGAVLAVNPSWWVENLNR